MEKLSHKDQHAFLRFPSYINPCFSTLSLTYISINIMFGSVPSAFSDITIVTSDESSSCDYLVSVESEFDLLDALIKSGIITGCAAACAFASYYYLPVIAFQVGYQGSLLASSLLVPHPSTLTYYSVVLPQAVHIGAYCYNCPFVATAIQSVSAISGAAVGNIITSVYEAIKQVCLMPSIVPQMLSNISEVINTTVDTVKSYFRTWVRCIGISC
jgi:hypothetical protein